MPNHYSVPAILAYPNEIKRNPVLRPPSYSTQRAGELEFPRGVNRFKMRKTFMGLAVMFGAAFSLTASYIPYPNPGTIAPSQTFVASNSGDVTAYFYGSGAGYDETLGLFVNGQQVGTWGLDDHTSKYGQSIDFGYVAAGSTLVFAIDVSTTNTIIYSDPTLNSDQDNHVYATAFAGQTQKGVTIPAGTYIGFEDMLAARSDFNYTDEQFVLGNTSFNPLGSGAGALAPEPTSLLSFGLGIFCIAIGSLGRKKRAVLSDVSAE
jgi:hypothetical protein